MGNGFIAKAHREHRTIADWISDRHGEIHHGKPLRSTQAGNVIVRGLRLPPIVKLLMGANKVNLGEAARHNS